MLVGPALVRNLTSRPDSATSSFGVQSRLDIASPAFGHVRATLFSEALVVPRFRGAAFATFTLGIGLRVP
ncbi:hypothetical protein [Gemmatimonas sp.]|uniref:hypothetical protein n=1 Tax=Gemmatimonas sp. TaxID=1962908 RepID=UPI00286E2A81|nr:hypothetical protein [Gemmatimonas sp.]